MSSQSADIAIVGIGPRGISIIERIAAALRSAPAGNLTLHLIEDSEVGAGRIWRTDQTRTLCMNTYAGAVTLFTEPGSSVHAPVVEGPTQYEWIRMARGDAPDDIAPAAVELFEAFPPATSLVEDFTPEIARSLPWSNPSRALYGAYLRWVLDVALALLPEWVEVVIHRSRAVGLRGEGDRDIITLDDATEVTADTTILAVGWQTPAPNAEEEELAEAVERHPELVWVRPGNPVEQNAADIPEGAHVLVRGLGMGFFDIMALCTINRGGIFHEDPRTRSGLRYEPSGREPHFLISSRRGYPYLPKSEYGSLPPAAKLSRLHAVIAELGSASPTPAGIDYDTQVWPAVARDAHEAFYTTLARVRPEAIITSLDQIVGVIDSTPVDGIPLALAAHSTEVFDLHAWEHPLEGVREPVEVLTARIASSLAVDIANAVEAWDSPLKSALWSISASRKPSSILGAGGRFTYESRRNRFAAVMSIGQMVGSGPPLFRTRELLALVDAGFASFAGADPQLSVQDIGDGAVWRITTPTTGEQPFQSTVLVDAWMHNPDARCPRDPLALSLEEAGRTRPFCHHTADGTAAPSGSPEVDPGTRRIVHADGGIDPRVHLIGIPTYAQMADTTISPMPGTDPLMLQETDRTALDALRVVGLIR
ncbi:FAD/NAD(P)-binding protein [Corynebacterium pacaense]|uniref:FAD/NAD(P)-binding protein n=1 Tax=Corynebacterium pacaense TaxID=1816684 RepID=UPI001FEC2F7D|nr:FAD/NAD(P)-binding protein [Corynebacterium pacaense]